MVMARFMSNLKLLLLGALVCGGAGWVLFGLSGDAVWVASWPAGGPASPAALGFALAVVIDRTD